MRPLNMGSGNCDYKLAAQLWLPGRESKSRLDRLMEIARQLSYLATHAGSFDIAHFHSLGWGALTSPLILHFLGKRAVFTMSLQGSDNPGAVKAAKRGSWAFRLMRRFDGVVALSPFLAKESEESGLRNVICLPNFLTLPRLERGPDADVRERLRRQLAVPGEATVLLFVGSVIARKGTDLLAESFARLAERHHGLWLILAGPQSKADDPDIDEEFVRRVRERLDRGGVATRVVWTGTVRDKDALAGYYSAADVFVFPTRAEGMPNVLCEAMTAGLPVVATLLPGITDFAIADGGSGFLFPPEDVGALTRALERLVSAPALRMKMGRAARESSRRFSFENYRRALKTFYLRVAGVSR